MLHVELRWSFVVAFPSPLPVVVSWLLVPSSCWAAHYLVVCLMISDLHFTSTNMFHVQLLIIRYHFLLEVHELYITKWSVWWFVTSSYQHQRVACQSDLTLLLDPRLTASLVACLYIEFTLSFAFWSCRIDDLWLPFYQHQHVACRTELSFTFVACLLGFACSRVHLQLSISKLLMFAWWSLLACSIGFKLCNSKL